MTVHIEQIVRQSEKLYEQKQYEKSFQTVKVVLEANYSYDEKTKHKDALIRGTKLFCNIYNQLFKLDTKTVVISPEKKQALLNCENVLVQGLDLDPFDKEMLDLSVRMNTLLCQSETSLDKKLTHMFTALQRNPLHPVTLYYFGQLHEYQNKMHDAIHYYKSSYFCLMKNTGNLTLKEKNTYLIKVLNSICTIYVNLGNMELAEKIVLKALESNPNDADLLNQTAVIYSHLRMTDKAILYYEKAIANINNRVISESKEELLSILYSNLGVMYSYDSDVERSVKSYKKALEYKKSLITYQNYLLDLNYIVHTFDDPMYITEQHKQITNYMTCCTTYQNDNYQYGEKHKLNIGFVSGDFINHSVSFFVKGILTRFNPDRLNIYCYSTKIVNLKEQYPNVEERFIHNKNTQDVCNLIKQDRIDILIDLAGHTSGNRLQVFALKPAPVQITYVGYPNTTGMPNIDYRITDKMCDSEKSEPYYSERLVYMPNCFLNYSPFDPLPKLEISPYASSDVLRIGCYNRLNKLNSSVLSLWKKLLTKHRNVKLVLKSKEFKNKTLKDTFFSQFKGVQSQIEILDPADSTFSHIEMYNKIDVAFDPFPYSGTTTSCEALSMGVPVITLYDNKRHYHVQNVTASLLHYSDLGEYIAYSEQEYETILEKQLAKTKEYWATHKEFVRNRFLNSSVCNSNQFYQDFETKMFELYKKE